MYGFFHIRSVSVGPDSRIWYLFIIYITGYLNVRKISETIDFRAFEGHRNKLGVSIILRRRTNLMNSALENAISNSDFLH